MDGRPYWRNKAAFSNSAGVVRTGPKAKVKTAVVRGNLPGFQ